MGLVDRLWRQRHYAGVDPASPDQVMLTQAHPHYALSGEQAASGSLRVNLSWSMRQGAITGSGAGFRGWGAGSLRPSALFKPIQAEAPASTAMVNVDLDLGCMYELVSGERGVVQPLGGLFGDHDKPPYIELSGDDRYGGSSGETMYINLAKTDQFKRLLVFVYIYDGTPAFDRAQGILSMFPYHGPRIEVRLDERAPQARSCAVAMIDIVRGRLTVHRQVRYVYGFQAELDRLYGWGLEWGRGYKTRH
jgi:tellurite resistance protein TerA